MRTRSRFIGLAGTALVAATLTASGPALAFETNAPATETVANVAPWQAAGVNEVMKMFRGGISADVIVSWINNSPLSFYLSADNIITLQQQGVPTPVVQAMIQRYGQLGRQATAQAQQAQSQGNVAIPAQAPAPQYYSYSGSPSFDAALAARQANSYNNYAFASTVYSAPAPVYDYYDPYLWGWDSYYPGVVVVGGRFGYGYGYHGGGGFHDGGGRFHGTGGFGGGGGSHGGGGFGGHGGGHR